METEISENNVFNCVPDVEITTKVGVSENADVPQEAKPDSTDKELSWEKIAAEIAAEEEGQNPENLLPTESTSASESTTEGIVSESTAEGVVSESTAEGVVSEPTTTREVQETVINTVTEQKTVTEESVVEEQETLEADTSDVITSSTETITETHVSTTETVTEESLPIVEESETLKSDVGAEPESTEAEAVESPDAKKQAIQITEVKLDESMEVAETIDEIEYTVVEAEEAETNAIIEEHVAQSTSETVVIINPDHTQTEITIEQVEEGDRSEDSSQDSYTEEIYVLKEGDEFVDDPKVKEKPKSRKPRGRKSMGEIPLHVLGRDITKPTEGVTNGGRVMPKPRLGVKVPYRNLTSQIVSKADIEKEIMDRFKQKQEQNAQNAADLMFARKLTQRLAKKLGPGDKKVTKETEAGTSTKENAESEIKNNSDLIAILEGDDDEISTPPPAAVQEPVKLTEREIALKQLEELPLKSPTKPTKPKAEEKEKENVVTQKEVKPKEAPLTASPQQKVEKKEVEPRLKTGMVIKTYTRKRKSFEMEPFLAPKKTVVATASVKTEDGIPSDAYITKSSRVIKRKVIWDPDEAPSKSPIKMAKVEQPVKTSPRVAEKKEAPIQKQQSPVKKPISKSPILKKPKRLTEVDKLLMDEGAVNMLYDVKNSDEPSPKKKNKSVINLDKAHKELMSKANLLKNDFQQNSPSIQKSLRKKDIPSPTSAKKEMKKEAIPSAVTRKKSKDSSRSTPPPSPAFNTAEASRIIRRHSSSSFSSNGEMDEEDENDDEVQEEEDVKQKKKVESSPKKKVKKNEKEKPKEVAKNNNNTTEAKANHVDKTVAQYKLFNVTKKNKLVNIKLLNSEGKCFLDEEVLRELTSCLKEFGKNDDCHVVSLTSDSNESFCEGLDYSELVVEDDAARKKKANELANLVKEFLRCLLNFPKVLVAGIQGQCVGLGVTMLPLFDMVIASDTSTFSAPYSDLGSIPEAGFLLTVPHLTNNGLASELFYASQKIKAEDAFRRGLVSRLCWPEKYQQELKSILSQTANQTRQSIMATKQQLRQHLLQSTDSALNSINKALVEYWISPECQANFAK